MVFLLQFLAYLSIVPMVLYAEWWHIIVSLVMYFLFQCFGMIMGYHRLLSHRSFNCPIWFEKLIVFFATFSLTGPAIDWVAIHRAHHQFADTDKDPHSPDFLGTLRVQFLTMFTNIKIKFASDLIKTPFYRFQRKHYASIIGTYGLLLFLIDPMAPIYAWLFPAAGVLTFGTMILSTSHRNFKPNNDFALALLTFGDGFHKTHHDDPNKYRLHKWDICGLIIERLFKNA